MNQYILFVGVIQLDTTATLPRQEQQSCADMERNTRFEHLKLYLLQVHQANAKTAAIPKP